VLFQSKRTLFKFQDYNVQHHSQCLIVKREWERKKKQATGSFALTKPRQICFCLGYGWLWM